MPKKTPEQTQAMLERNGICNALTAAGFRRVSWKAMPANAWVQELADGNYAVLVPRTDITHAFSQVTVCVKTRHGGAVGKVGMLSSAIGAVENWQVLVALARNGQ